MIDFGFIIINKCRALRSDVREWIRRPENEKTYANFKLHFTEAHLELRATDATVDELGYHSANAVVQQIVDQLRLATTDEPPLESSSQFSGIDQNLPPVVLPAPEHAPSPVPQTTNSTITNDPRISQMMEQLLRMEERADAHDNAAYDQGRDSYHSYGRGRGRGRQHGYYGQGRGRNQQNGRGGRPPRLRRGGKYCHTHGNCAHTSAECETQAEGHVSTDTFANMQGGSTANCE